MICEHNDLCGFVRIVERYISMRVRVLVGAVCSYKKVPACDPLGRQSVWVAKRSFVFVKRPRDHIRAVVGVAVLRGFAHSHFDRLHGLEYSGVKVPVFKLLPHLIANSLMQGVLTKTPRRFVRDRCWRGRHLTFSYVGKANI